ncbi:MAG: purine-nucleoside phosphorylase, partial [Saprospiraceae bacterium]|nr:purine-nucleoside phosphorylase [Saprospiraceae bacterium]
LEAKVGDIAETVLLPGDPLRAKHVAETMLEQAICYNKVRGMFGFTGYYQGKRVSIQGSGMGMGSAGIYINELISTYQVKNIIRVGTCGALQKSINLGEVIVAMSASGDSDANAHHFKGMHFAATAEWELLYKAVEAAKKMNIKTLQGSVFSTNTFYDESPNRWDVWEKHGILGVDMESQILFTLAKRLGAKALSLLTVSDNIITGAASSQKDREQSFNDMMKIALEIA